MTLTRIQNLLASSAVVCSTLGSTPALAAESNEERAAAVSQKTVTAAGNTLQIGGVSYHFRPYIETESGFDSNPDNLFAAEGTNFLKLESGLKASAEATDQYYGLTLRGRFVDFMDLEDNPRQRSDFKAALDASFTLSDQETLHAGSYYLRDLISLAQANIYHSYLDYAYRTEDFRLKVSGKSHVEQNLGNERQEAGSLDDFNVSRSKAFDYSRADGQVSLLTFTRFWLQPFGIYNLASSVYFNQVAGASIDRNSHEQYGIIGTRVQLNKLFRIDVGFRFNDRDFDDRTFHQGANEYLDVNLFWQPLDKLKFTAIIERFFDEPSTSFGVADDVKSHGLTVEWGFAPKWRLASTTYYDIEDAIGDEIRFEKVTATLSVTYDAHERLELYFSTLGKWVEEEVTGDTYERYKAGLGARLRF